MGTPNESGSDPTPSSEGLSLQAGVQAIQSLLSEPSGSKDESDANASKEPTTDDGDTKEPADEELDLDVLESEESDDVDEEVDEDDVEEESDEDQQEPDRYRVKVDGQEVEVTLQELKDGFSMTADYTRKTQALAEERKAFATEQEQIRAARDQYLEAVKAVEVALGDEPEPDWAQRQQQNPDGWLEERAQWQIRADDRRKVKDERAKLEATQQAEMKAELEKRVTHEVKALLVAKPELEDREKFSAFLDGLAEYGATQKFTRDEVKNTVDHRLLLTLEKARLYDRAVAKREQLRKKTRDAPVSEPGSRRARGSSKARQRAQQTQRLATSGSVDDAVAVIKGLNDL